MKTLISIVALLFSGLCSASAIELRDNCNSLKYYITSQDEINAVVDCLYNKRNEQISGGMAAAMRRLSSVSPLFEIDLDKLTQSVPAEHNENYYRYYIETVAGQSGDKASRILLEHYEKYAVNANTKAVRTLIESINPDNWEAVRDIAERLRKAGRISDGGLKYITVNVEAQLKKIEIAIKENKKIKQNTKFMVKQKIINDKYSYLRDLLKRNPQKYLHDSEQRLSELENSLRTHIGDNIEAHHRSVFRDDYHGLGNYAVHVAGEPEKAIDFYLKAVEYKVVPRKLPDNLSESQKERIQRDTREAIKALLAMGAIGDKPNTPCYKIYELLGNQISKRHRAYTTCHDELKKIGIPLFSMFDSDNDTLDLKPSVLKVNIRLTTDTDGAPLRSTSKVLIESAYRDLDEHFCNELQLIDTNSKGEATITVRKNRFVRATILDRAWSNNQSEESVKLSIISTHKDSTRFNEIVLHVKSLDVNGYNENNKGSLFEKISHSLKDCRGHKSPSKIMGDVDRLLYLLADYGIARPHTTRAKNIGYLNNAVLSTYHEEIAFTDELSIFKHGALHRLALAPDQYDKADLYNLEMGLLLNQIEPLMLFVGKYGASAINSYFGDECSFSSYVLSIYSSRKSIDREIEKVLRLYEGGRYSHISRDKLNSNKTRYENAKLAYEKMEGFHSDVADFSVKNNLLFSDQQQKSSCNKTFIDEFLTEVAHNNDVAATRMAVHLGVNPNYEMSYGGAYITVMSRSQDVVVALLELGADPMIEAASGIPLRTISINQEYRKIISYYINHDLIAGLDVRSYAKLFDINMNDPEINRKLLSHLVSASESEADKIIQAAALTGRVDILDKVFSSGFKIKKMYESPVSGRNNTITHTLDGLHDEYLILNATRGKFSDNVIQTIDVLVKNGADVNASSQGYTAISYAVRYGTYELISKLIGLGADPSFVPQDGAQVMLNASKRNLVFSNGCFTHLPTIGDAVKSYLDSNKDAPDRDEYEHCRVSQHKENFSTRSGSDYKIVKLLIDNHVDVNVSTRFGRTPLMLYALKRDDRVVDLLLKNGADPEAKDAYGKTYLDYRKDTAPKITIPSATGNAYLGEGTVVTIPERN